MIEIKTKMGEVFSAQDKLKLLTEVVTRLEAGSRGVRDTVQRLASLLTSTHWLTAGLEADTVWGLLLPSFLDAR